MAVLDNLDVNVYEAVFFLLSLVSCMMLVYSAVLPLVLLPIIYKCLLIIKRRKRQTLKTEGKAVLITGCDTGFGNHLAKRLYGNGYTVFAGVLSDKSDGANNLRSINSERLNVVQLDVTSQEDVNNAIHLINRKRCGLWGVVNNAGLGLFGEIEYMPIDEYRRCAEVNLYGVIRVTQACLPLIRQSKGRIVNISSVKGRFPWPYYSAYHVTKYGLETLSDSLRLEMIKFNVKVAIIEPGWYNAATSISKPAAVERTKRELDSYWELASDEVKDAYGRGNLDAMIDMKQNTEIGGAKSADPVLNAIEDALINVWPQRRYLIHGSAGYVDPHAILAEIYGFLPSWLTDWIIVWLSGCKKTYSKNKEKSL